MVQRYNPDYVMHAARFAPFAREAEHGEFVKFSDYEALVSELASSRQINAQTLQVKLGMADTIKELEGRVNALAVENAALKSAITGKAYIDFVTSNGWNPGMKTINGKFAGFMDAEIDFGCMAYDHAKKLIDAVETPATDAALAAIQAQGVEKAAAALDALSAQSASATTQANFRAAAVYLRTTVLPAIGEAK
ncbi:hypothetical protein [Serratia marcescens]|uniref:hypothetical protein n=1 Tax=Serratia marcescens TaxID=615 RepID=UPI0007455A8A|nr:hypothetical protein [Serratia marcescens]CUZ48374.1 Uncharacterised protein [Serratia marcescens]CVA12898.1 Uncharacterised protein [Serratia marcescens]CVC89225.1 Uncharacterised protein [Serratia marcescens]CVE89497.1 Uncharacterised protein [Serratia marcescens]CVH34768.1 Uncharacterised protein [Serratia marcescens]